MSDKKFQPYSCQILLIQAVSVSDQVVIRTKFVEKAHNDAKEDKLTLLTGGEPG